MKNGGTIILGTRDQPAAALSPGRFRGASSGGPGARRLREILRGLDIPPLVPVPKDHVLTKAFYLLSAFPGRWRDGTVWVERHAGGTNDGVSSIIISSNAWAAAWAIDEAARPIAAAIPGGASQRAMAFRLGSNRGDEILRARLAGRLAPERIAEMWPPYPAGGPVTAEDLAGLYKGLPLDALAALEPAGTPRGASNAWAVAGTRTQSWRSPSAGTWKRRWARARCLSSVMRTSSCASMRTCGSGMSFCFSLSSRPSIHVSWSC